jgi:CO/xanthine dehydrogenase FAD-binding subunit
MTDYACPDTLPEALDILTREDRLVLAGGTDLFAATSARRLDRPVLDLTRIAALAGLTETAEGLRIGACTSWAAIAAARLPPALDALRQAAVEVGGRQIQTTGTIGGNLCNASPAADGVPPLLAVAAEVELASARGTRRLPLADFLAGPRRTLRAADEVVTAVLMPRAGLTGRSRFLKLGARRDLVISIAMVAVRLEIAAGAIVSAAVAVGACGPVALRLPAVEAALLGASAGAASRIASEDVLASLSPIDDIRASGAYRAEAAVELLRRAVGELAA